VLHAEATPLSSSWGPYAMCAPREQHRRQRRGVEEAVVAASVAATITLSQSGLGAATAVGSGASAPNRLPRHASCPVELDAVERLLRDHQGSELRGQSRQGSNWSKLRSCRELRPGGNVNMPTDIQRGSIVRGPMLPEPIEVVTTVRLSQSLQLVGKGLETGKFYDPVLTEEQVAELVVSGDRPAFDGDARLFRLGVEAHRLGLAYEYDPYFSLSIARVDPLPHQIEAVYHYFLKLPRIRFLLSDDPGAGKTIMAGLLLKELKARGLVKRTLIVAPADLTFQWQREMQDKFRQTFEVLRGSELRSAYGQNPCQERDQVVTSTSWVS